MPGRYDLGEIAEHEEEEARKSGRALGARRKFTEFECPTCSAHNPYDDFGHKDDLVCNWCGTSFVALVDDEGTLTLRDA